MVTRLEQALDDVRNALRLAREDRAKYREVLVREGCRSYFKRVPIGTPDMPRCPTCGSSLQKKESAF